MTFPQEQVAQAVASHYGELPHPDIASGLVKVKEYPAYERVANMLYDRQLNGQKATAQHVEHAAQTLLSAGISPGEFEQVWSVARPSANRLLGRDPSIQELTQLKHAPVSEIHHHYLNHPYPGYEEVTAGQMARYWRTAEPLARRYGHTVNAHEVSRFAVAGYSDEDMHTHYQER